MENLLLMEKYTLLQFRRDRIISEPEKKIFF